MYGAFSLLVRLLVYSLLGVNLSLARPVEFVKALSSLPLYLGRWWNWVLAETEEEFAWKPFPSTYPDLNLTQAAYMDDLFLWEEKTRAGGSSLGTSPNGVFVPTSRNAHCIPLRSTWGKTTYRSPGPDYMRKSMGIQFKVGSNVAELLAPVWETAKRKFWALKHILCKNLPSGKDEGLCRGSLGGRHSGVWLHSARNPRPWKISTGSCISWSYICCESTENRVKNGSNIASGESDWPELLFSDTWGSAGAPSGYPGTGNIRGMWHAGWLMTVDRPALNSATIATCTGGERGKNDLKDSGTQIATSPNCTPWMRTLTTLLAGSG